MQKAAYRRFWQYSQDFVQQVVEDSFRCVHKAKRTMCRQGSCRPPVALALDKVVARTQLELLRVNGF